MKSKILGITGLAVLAVGATSNAQLAPTTCSPDTTEALFSKWSEKFSSDEKAPIENFADSLLEVLQSKCDAKLISKQDLEAIVGVAKSLNGIYPELHTETNRSSAYSITTYVQFGLNHTLNGLCASDVGSPSAVFDCVCTQVQVTELAVHSGLKGAPNCR